MKSLDAYYAAMKQTFEWPDVIRPHEAHADPVTVHPEIMHGKACFAGTRVPVEFLFEWIEESDIVHYFLSSFPTVSSEDVLEVLRRASRHAEETAVKAVIPE